MAKKDKQSEMPEAVASVTYTIQTKNGFNALFTTRHTSGLDLLEMMKSIEKKFIEEGIIPQPKGKGYQKKEPQVVPDIECPDCGKPVVEGETKDGKKYHKCSTQKYDFKTKETSGCKYFRWVD